MCQRSSECTAPLQLTICSRVMFSVLYLQFSSTITCRIFGGKEEVLYVRDCFIDYHSVIHYHSPSDTLAHSGTNPTLTPPPIHACSCNANMSMHFLSADELVAMMRETGLWSVNFWAKLTDNDSTRLLLKTVTSVALEHSVVRHSDMIIKVCGRRRWCSSCLHATSHSRHDHHHHHHHRHLMPPCHEAVCTMFDDQCFTRDGGRVRCLATVGSAFDAEGGFLLILRLYPLVNR